MRDGEGASYQPDGSTLSHAYINEFTASSEGLRLVKAFTRIARPAVRQHIVMLVQEIAGSAAAYGFHEDRTPMHGYEPTREAAMQAFARSWHRE